MTDGALSHVAGEVRPPRLTVPTRVRLVAEVLAAYAAMYRRMRTARLDEAVAAARAVEPSASRFPDHDDVLLAMRLGHIASRTLRPLPTDTRCLVRSLVLLRMLARRGIDATIVVGVRSDSEFAAHAWVEHCGRPLLPAGRFERLLEM